MEELIGVEFKVAYKPKFSREFLKMVFEDCTESMTSEDTSQFEISEILDTISSENMPENDSKLLMYLLEVKEMAYIEIENKYGKR